MSNNLDSLVIDYLNGNVRVFDEIYELTKTSVFLSIYPIIKDKSLTEDLMQDTYMKALEYLDKYKIGTNFKAWISRIARNLAINFYNHRKREDIVEFDEIKEEKEDNTLLSQTMRILEGEEREIVIQHIILGFTFSQISKTIGKPLGTIFWSYQKALKKIKESL